MNSNTEKKAGTRMRYPLMEGFYTLQGEGFHSGKAAYFIRLAGCDVGCVWCDVKDSWEAEGYPKLTSEEIISRAKQYPVKIAVITGGEPTLYDLGDLTSHLKQNGFRTHLETSGAHPLSGTWDWVCLSPKKFKPPVESALSRADELKIIVFNKSDFQWAEKYAQRVRPDCVLLLQPEWSKREVMSPLIIDYIKENPQWRLSVQTHKFVGIP